MSRLGITDPQTKLRLNISHDFQARILECSQAIRVEYQVFLQFFGHQCLKTRELDLIVSLDLSLFLVARHIRFQSFDPRLKFQKMARYKKKGRSQQVSFPCRRIMTFLQSSPCLQRVLLRVGDNVSCLITRESHECCMHLLQHELLVANSSFHIRHSRQEFQIAGCRRDLRRLFS